MKGSALIKRFQDKSRQLKESAEFERFLDSHERIWQDHERAQQGRGMKGIQRGAAPRPAITRDDLGGAQVVNKLRKSRAPEAELDALIKSAERNGDMERASRLQDFQTEYQFQRQEISAGIRQGYEDLNRTYARAGIGELGRQEKERQQQVYMTTQRQAEAEAGAQQGGGADFSLKRSAEGEVYGSVSGNVATAVGSRLGDDGNYNSPVRSARDALKRDSAQNNPAFQPLRALMRQYDSVETSVDGYQDQIEARKKLRPQIQQALLALQNKGSQSPSDRRRAAQDAVKTAALNLIQNKPDANQVVDDMVSGIDKVQQAPAEKRAEVAKKELSKPEEDPEELVRQLADVDPKAAAAAAQFMQQDKERAQQEKPKPFERTLSDADREKRETDRIQGASWKREVGDDEQAIKDRLKEMGLTHSTGGQWRDSRGNLGATLRNGKVTFEPGYGDREDEPKRRGIGDPAPEREPGEVMDASQLISAPTEEEERQKEAKRLKLTHVGGGIYERANGTRYRWENGRFVEVKASKGTKTKAKKKPSSSPKGKGKDDNKEGDELKEPKEPKATKGKGGFKPKAVKRSAAARRVLEDKRKGINPFSRRPTRDPALESHLEMASKKVTAIRKQMKDIFDQMKREKNPQIKERLKERLAGLDRQLGTAYVTLERIKALSGSTTELGGHSHDSMKTLFRDAEKLSIEAADLHGQQPAVFTAATTFKSKNGFTSLEQFFKDSNQSMKDRFNKNANKEPVEGADQVKVDKPDDFSSYAETIDEKEIDELEEPGDDFEDPGDEADAQSVPTSVFDIGDEKTPEQIRAEAEARESAARDQEAFDAKYFDPYKDETTSQRRRRVKAEREITRERKNLHKVLDPVMKRASYVSIRTKLDEKGKTQKRQAQAAFNYAFGILVGEYDRMQQSIDNRGLFKQPVERDFYSEKHEEEIDAKVRKLNIGGGSGDPVDDLVNNLQTLRGQKPLSEEEKVMAKMILVHHAFDQDGKISKYGKAYLEAVNKFNSDIKYERNEARDLYRNLLYSVRHGLSMYHPTKQEGEGNVLSGLRTKGLNQLSPWALRNKQAETLLRQTANLDGDNKLRQTTTGPDGEEIEFFTKAPSKVGGDSAVQDLGYQTYRNNQAAALRALDDQLEALNEIPDEDLKEPIKGGPEKARRTDERLLDQIMGRDKVKAPRRSGIRTGKGSAQEIRRRARSAALRKRVDEGVLFEDTTNWSWEKVNEGGYGFCVWMNAVSDAERFFSESVWGTEVRRAAKALETLTTSHSYLAENQMATGCAQLLSEQIEEMLSPEGIVSFVGYEQDLEEMSSEERARYKIAEREFHEKNEFYYPIEKFVILNEYANNTTSYLDIPVSPINHQVLRENTALESTEFYQALLEVSQEVVEHCGCEQKDKMKVDKGPQRVKEIPLQAAPAPSRKPQTATEILAAMKPPRKKLSLRRSMK